MTLMPRTNLQTEDDVAGTEVGGGCSSDSESSDMYITHPAGHAAVDSEALDGSKTAAHEAQAGLEGRMLKQRRGPEG